MDSIESQDNVKVMKKVESLKELCLKNLDRKRRAKPKSSILTVR
jgi:hypothetical protein